MNLISPSLMMQSGLLGKTLGTPGLALTPPPSLETGSQDPPDQVQLSQGGALGKIPAPNLTALPGLLALANSEPIRFQLGAGGCPFGLLGVVATGLTKDGKMPPLGYVAIHSLGGAEAGDALLAGDPALARCIAQRNLTSQWIG